MPTPFHRAAREARRRLVIPVDAARRKFLFAFGVAFCGIGFSYMVATPEAPVRVALMWIPGVPFSWLGLMWVLCGLLAIAMTFGPSVRDRIGFRALAVPPTLWSLCYAVATFLAVFDHYYAPRAWVSVIIFGVIAFAVDVVSGMIDADAVTQLEDTLPPKSRR